jgi:hypothetical protein
MTRATGRRFNVTDDLTRRLAGQLLRGVKAVHEENNPDTPLGPGTPVRPHAAAERIGISPVGRRYAEVLAYLVEEGALEPNGARAILGEVVGDHLYVLGENAAGMTEA